MNAHPIDKKKITTPSGFTAEIDSDVFDDIELFEALCEVDDGNVTQLPKLIKGILGEDGKKRLYDHVRDENRKASVTAVADELKAIFEAFGEKK